MVNLDTFARREILAGLSFGQRVAEDEAEELSRYFVRTPEWQKLQSGNADLVFGVKGAGKSALYALLSAERDTFAQRRIALINAENPQGTPAFANLVDDPPTPESDLKLMWKLYFLSLVGDVISDNSSGDAAKAIIAQLEEMSIRRRGMTLGNTLILIRDFLSRIKGITVEVTTDLFGNTSFKPKVAWSGEKVAANITESAVDQLLGMADAALAECNMTAWLLLDRLDVAFERRYSDTRDDEREQVLESNALRALLRTYQDLKDKRRIRLKIFLRSDIWERITRGGFREASHLASSVTIRWDKASLLNLVLRRVLNNAAIKRLYRADNAESVLSSMASAEEFFYRIFPRQVNPRTNQSTTFDWMLARTKDGTQTNAPRELIHLLVSSLEMEQRRLSIGESDSEGERLFSGNGIKAALPEVSEVRFKQTLVLEHPELERYLDAMREQKALQNLQSLSKIWDLPEVRAQSAIDNLVDIGFFERQTGRARRVLYKVPFLYRPVLKITQGRAIGVEPIDERQDDDEESDI